MLPFHALVPSEQDLVLVIYVYAISIYFLQLRILMGPKALFFSPERFSKKAFVRSASGSLRVSRSKRVPQHACGFKIIYNPAGLRLQTVRTSWHPGTPGIS